MKRQAQGTLDSFLCPKIPRSEASENISQDAPPPPHPHPPSAPCNSVPPCPNVACHSSPHDIFDDDIGSVYVDGELQPDCVRQLNDTQRVNLLKKHWMPGEDFIWPFHQKKKQKVFLRQNHISGPIYGCFKFSKVLSGLICVPCALFSSCEAENDKRKMTPLGMLVKTPLHVYKSLTGSGSHLDSHLQTQYHKSSQHRADAFLMMMSRQDNVLHQLDAERKQQVLEQRQRLHPIVKTVEVCGRLGVAYRGRSDDGAIDLDSPLAISDGNFRALLRFRVEAGESELIALIIKFVKL